jgi:hypothetical protein
MGLHWPNRYGYGVTLPSPGKSPKIVGPQTESSITLDGITILDLTRIICEVVGFAGGIAHDLSKPDGTPGKLMDSAKLRSFGWRPRLGLKEGIAAVYRWFLEHGLAKAAPNAGSRPPGCHVRRL